MLGAYGPPPIFRMSSGYLLANEQGRLFATFIFNGLAVLGTED
jgi:hypothetical protein